MPAVQRRRRNLGRSSATGDRSAIPKLTEPRTCRGISTPRRPEGSTLLPATSSGRSPSPNFRGRPGLGAGHVSRWLPASQLTATNKLAAAYESAGRTREAVPLLAALSSANLNDGILALKVAGLQAWFGQHRELAATRQRMIASAANDFLRAADRTAKVCCILQSTDKAELEARARPSPHGCEDDTCGEEPCLMAEYRNGNYGPPMRALVTTRPRRLAPNHAVGTAASSTQGDEPVPAGKADRGPRSRPSPFATMAVSQGREQPWEMIPTTT